MNEAATLAFRLGRKLHRDVVAAAPMPDGKATLELASLHGGGRPDQFALVPPHPARPGATEDFGYLFDVDGDGRFDWIVFNGGPLFDRGFKHMLWMNYHFIDTNGDGRVDVMVFNDVDLDGDRFYDEDVTAWLYDRDFDGTFDEGEYLGPFGSRPVPRSGDDLVLSLALGEKRISTRAAGCPPAAGWSPASKCSPSRSNVSPLCGMRPRIWSLCVFSVSLVRSVRSNGNSPV